MFLTNVRVGKVLAIILGKSPYHFGIIKLTANRIIIIAFGECVFRYLNSIIIIIIVTEIPPYKRDKRRENNDIMFMLTFHTKV